LLAQENSRTFQNKISEIFYTLALESFNSKQEILKMYANSAYFGNQLQGIESASLGYFGVGSSMLTPEMSLQMLAALNSPTDSNPGTESNIAKAKTLGKTLKITVNDTNFVLAKTTGKNLINYQSDHGLPLELQTYANKISSAPLTLDSQIQEKARRIVADNVDLLSAKLAKNAAAVIISLPQNEIISMIGSPDPQSNLEGYQINMLNEPRQIGSTIKPFIYLKAFEKGMRPYTIIDDREYKYYTGAQLPLYPKNYDWTYHGLMTANYALSNSINVAAVKTLEYAGVDDFTRFLQQDLNLKTGQDINQYQLGIALGDLETNLLDLAHIFTIFPNDGQYKNLVLSKNSSVNDKIFASNNSQIVKKDYVELINKILSDRKIAMDQFGAQSDLNLPATNYALKTGTSHDYTDSWVVGYTPDFLVAVWMGNADASAMDGLSGQLGAGRIWSDLMQMMLASNYNKKTPFDFGDIKDYQGDHGIEYGLATDDFKKCQALLQAADTDLIITPHDADVFQFAPNARLELSANAPATWQINGQNQGTAKSLIFTPPAPGQYQIAASSGNLKEEITIFFVKK
jgi:membrane carboxypeptidase/penicillin-binding protein PbpC